MTNTIIGIIGKKVMAQGARASIVSVAGLAAIGAWPAAIYFCAYCAFCLLFMRWSDDLINC